MFPKNVLPISCYNFTTIWVVHFFWRDYLLFSSLSRLKERLNEIFFVTNFFYSSWETGVMCFDASFTKQLTVIQKWINRTVWGPFCHTQAVQWWRAVKGAVKVTTDGLRTEGWGFGILARWGVTWESLCDGCILMRDPLPSALTTAHFFLFLSFSRLRLRSLVVITALRGGLILPSR